MSIPSCGSEWCEGEIPGDLCMQMLKVVPPLVRDSLAAHPEVHVWCVRTDLNETQCAELAGILAPAEKAAGSKFHFAADRIRYLVSHAQLRWLLAQYAGVDPETITFRATEYGKPFIAEPPIARGLCFNLSHSGQLALVAVTRNRELGVDIERLKDKVAAEELADRFFCSPERNWLKTLPQEERCKGFFRLWTVKEAVLKAQGTGLGTLLDGLCVRLTGDSRVLVNSDGPLGQDWFVEELQVAQGYAGAIALKGKAPARIRMF